MKTSAVRVRAIRTQQAGLELFSFFVAGSRLTDIAELSRIQRAPTGEIVGFQRPEIRHHVKSIVSYLDRGNVLFPNAIILALGPGYHFTAARGTKPESVDAIADAGTLTLPVLKGKTIAWVVDGQQRTLALSETTNAMLPVPVVAFASKDIDVRREQFILVNKAKPLSPRLIDELLPEVGADLPRDLSVRRVPSTLCNVLNVAKDSPFCGLIRRPSGEDQGVVTDSALLKAIRRSIIDPRGALAMYASSDGHADLDQMYRTLAGYWRAVREVFPDAWGLPAEESRLMHAAGIEAMSVLMDQLLSRLNQGEDAYAFCIGALRKIAPFCRWTSGRWDGLDRAWNDLQCTPKDVRALSNYLLGLEREIFRKAAA